MHAGHADVVAARKRAIGDRTGGIDCAWLDRQVGKLVRSRGRTIRREMKRGTRSLFRDGTHLGIDACPIPASASAKGMFAST